jgi:hypothetical protein
MLRPMRLVDRWQTIEQGLRTDWTDARLELSIADEEQADRAAALLGPLMPGRSGKRIRFFAARRGAGPSPGAVRRLLALLDEEQIGGELRLLASGQVTEVEPQTHRATLLATWEAALATLADDWSDLYGEVELTSSDDFERGALLMAPLNPARFGGTPGFRFRVARRFGYGASPQMVRRCLERLDEAGIPGEVRILLALSDTKPASTQGPVWYLGGKAV